MHGGPSTKKKPAGQHASQPKQAKEAPPNVLREKKNVNVPPAAGEQCAKPAPKDQQKPTSQQGLSKRPSSQSNTDPRRQATNSSDAPNQGSTKPAPRAIMTQRNKYAHVPAKVVTTGPQSALHAARNKMAQQSGENKAAQHPKRSAGAMSHEDFFGPGGKKTEHVKSVLHRSSYITSKADKPAAEVVVKSKEEPKPEIKATPSPTPLPTPTIAQTLSFKDLVMDASVDLPARRSLSAPRLPRTDETQRSSSSLPLPLPRSRPISPRTSDAKTESDSRDGAAVSLQPLHAEGSEQTTKGGWLQWLLSPKTKQETKQNESSDCDRPSAAVVVFPEGNDADDIGVRSSRWSVHESFRADAQSRRSTANESSEGATEQHEQSMSDILTLRTHNTTTEASGMETDRMSRSITLTRYSSDTALTAISPMTDISRATRSERASDELRNSTTTSIHAEDYTDGRASTSRRRSTSAGGPTAPPNTPAGRPSEGGAGRWSTNSVGSVAQPGAPPNTPAGRPSEGGAGRWSTNSVGSVAQPGAPPNTPAGRPSEGDAGRWSTNSVGSVAQPGAPPNTPSGRISERRDEVSPSESQPRRSGSWLDALWATPHHAPPSAEESVAQFDIPSPPPTLPPGHVNADVAVEPRGSTEVGGWFDRIRSSLLLRPSARGTEAPSPGIETPCEGGSVRRRKSVQFCDPDALEVRIDDDFADACGTPRRSICKHNEDPLSPVPILIRNSGRLSGRYSIGNTAEVQPPTADASEGDAIRSDSPSRQHTEDTTPFNSETPHSAGLTATHELLLSPAVEAPLSPEAPTLGHQRTHVMETSLPLPPPANATPRSHKVDRLGRVCRSKTPGRTSGGLLSPMAAETAPAASAVPPRHPGRNATAPSPMVPLNSPPPALQHACDGSRVAAVLQHHTIASALRLLTTMEIAAYLAANDVDFDPADRKAKLLDTARKLVMHERRSASGSESVGLDSSRAPSFTFSISLPQPEGPPSGKRGREEAEMNDQLLRNDDDDELPIPTSSWTVPEIREFAQRRGISFHGVPQRKAELLRHISSSIGRSRSTSMI